MSGKKRGEGGKPSKAGKYLAVGVLGAFGAAAIAAVVAILFPHRATLIDIQNKDALHTVFYSGKPHFVACNNGSKIDAAALTAAERAMPFLALEGVETVTFDCYAPLPSGMSTVERFRLSPWKPLWIVVSNGGKPHQLSPALYTSGVQNITQAVKKVIGNKMTTIRNTVDFDKCLKSRIGGCIIAYTRVDKDTINEAFKVPMEDNRNITFAHQDTAQLALVGKEDTAVAALLKDAIKVAASAASNMGVPGILLVFIRRTPKELAESYGADTFLVNIGHTAAAGQLTERDVSRLITGSVRAADQLLADASSSADNIERLLQRDETLLELNAALIQKGDIRVAQPRAAESRTKKTASQATEATDERLARGAQRRARRERQKNAATPEPTPETLTPEEAEGRRLAQEKARREQMERESLESAHVPHAAEGEWDEEAFDGEGDDYAGEAEVVDEEVLEQGDE